MIDKTFNTGLMDLHFTESSIGGTPLLLLHGLFISRNEFKSLFPELENKYHIFAPDLRGHGQSDRNSSYRIEDFSNDIASFIEGQIKQPTVIFGCSLGGMIAIMVAAQKPNLVKAVIVGDSILSKESIIEFSNNHYDKTVWWQKLAETNSLETIINELKNELIPLPNQKDFVPAYKVFGENHPSFQFFADCIINCDPIVFLANANHIDNTYAEYNVNELLPKITCPILILQGNPELGAILNDSDVEKAKHLLPTIQHIKMKNAGHFLHLQDKDSVLNALITFIESSN